MEMVVWGVDAVEALVTASALPVAGRVVPVPGSATTGPGVEEVGGVPGETAAADVSAAGGGVTSFLVVVAGTSEVEASGVVPADVSVGTGGVGEAGRPGDVTGTGLSDVDSGVVTAPEVWGGAEVVTTGGGSRV